MHIPETNNPWKKNLFLVARCDELKAMNKTLESELKKANKRTVELKTQTMRLSGDLTNAMMHHGPIFETSPVDAMLEKENKELKSKLLEFQRAEENALPRKTFRITFNNGEFTEVKAHKFSDSPDEMKFYVNGESDPIYILSKATMLSVEVI